MAIHTSKAADQGPLPDKEALKQEISRLLEDCALENWDGEGALPVSTETVDIALKLVDFFPEYMGAPYISASPQGEVEFDWAGTESGMLTVGVCPTREVAFAALFNDSRVSGSQLWDGKMSPLIECCFQRMRHLIQQ